MLLLLPFYIAFMFGHLLTSVLYALGNTNLIALKSVLGTLATGTLRRRGSCCRCSSRTG